MMKPPVITEKTVQPNSGSARNPNAAIKKAAMPPKNNQNSAGT